MIRFPHGRGGWRSSARIVVVAGAAAALISIASCSSKKHTAEGEGSNEVGTGSLGEGSQSESSLDDWKKGLSPGRGGPLSDIHFGYNDYSIEAQDSSVLRVNATWLSKHPNTHVQVEGHCDERGSEEYNIALGARRAQAAKDYLETLGVSSQRISTISYGKELPLCTEHDESCWSQNRRDHFVVQ